MGKVIDLTGQRFGRLVVIGETGYATKTGLRFLQCKCDCGNIVSVRIDRLTGGRQKSCGCLRKENGRKALKKWNNTKRGGKNPAYKHGASCSRLYRVWANMKQRCTNPQAHEYSAYGGRGIKVCDLWLHDFEAFRSWALQAGYDEHAPRGGCTIDRIDNDKGYNPENCRWIPMQEQYKNKQTSGL